MEKEETGLERAGYRVNAKYTGSTFVHADEVVVFAERTKLSTLKLYGGDAYPAVHEQALADKSRVGFIIAADGVGGQASYGHQSLKEYLDGIPGITMFAENGENGKKDRDRAKLSAFLRKLYGSKIFADSAALDYALRCFSDVPTGGYYVADSAVWFDKENAQQVMPFYERDSQSLGSRIVCVGLYMKFREYLAKNNIKELNASVVKTLCDEIEHYIYGELKNNVISVINYSDAPTTDKRDRYFLPSTVAMWFYIMRPDGSLSAAALNMGDARCYLADVENGLRQISIDDAFPDGGMSAVVHFGQNPKTEEGYSDGTFRARIISAKAPCALFVCSDGVYDTCPTVKSENPSPIGNDEEAPSDFLFEKNLLDGMRRCYSLHDFEREIVFGCYAQAPSGRGFNETYSGKSYTRVKRDDSGTLAAKFFGKTPTELFDALRQNKSTTLDRLYETVVACKGVLPYSPPHVKRREDREEELAKSIANKLLTNDVFNELQLQYPVAFDSMKAAQSTVLWGIEHAVAVPLTGFDLKTKFLRVNINKIAITKCILDDWVTCGSVGIPQDWTSHEHVVTTQKLYELLVQVNIEQYVMQLSENSGLDDDKALELYAMFDKSFFGEQCPREEVQVWDYEKTKRTVLTVEQVNEIVEKYKRLNEEKKLEAESKKQQPVQPQQQPAQQSQQAQATMPRDISKPVINEQGAQSLEEEKSESVNVSADGIISESDEPATSDTNKNGDSDK